MNLSDVPWVIKLGLQRYPESYDPDMAGEWLANVVLRNPLMFYAIRTEHAFCVSYINTYPWLPGEMECAVTLILAEQRQPWEVLKLLRQSIAWGKRRGCKHWSIASDTDFDLKPIARRLGAKEIFPRFRMELNHG